MYVLFCFVVVVRNFKSCTDFYVKLKLTSSWYTPPSLKQSENPWSGGVNVIFDYRSNKLWTEFNLFTHIFYLVLLNDAMVKW